MSIRLFGFVTLVSAFFLTAAPAMASTSFDGAKKIADPATASRAEYGRIDRPGAIKYYSVTPSKTISVTLEAVVPVRSASSDFRPAVAVLTPEAGASGVGLPFSAPAGYHVTLIKPDASNPRRTLFDPNSIERFYRNGSQSVSLPGEQTSYLAVYDPAGHTGDYVLGVASSPYYENASRRDLLAQGIALKFGAADGRSLPWADVLGAVLAMLGLVVAGVTAAMALLPRPQTKRRALRWRYGMIATAFISILSYYAGLRILNRDTGMIAVASFQEILSVLLLLAAAWLVLQSVDSPARRNRIFVFLWGSAWFIQTLLLAWYLLVTRTT